MTSQTTPQNDTTTQDWASKATQRVESLTDLLRSKSVRPAFTIARYLSFGLVGAAIGLTILILFVILIVRLLTVYLFAEHVWITYLVLGGISTLGGMVAWSRMVKPKS